MRNSNLTAWIIELLVASSVGGCLSGCTDPVEHQFGYTQAPPAVIVKSGLGGKSLVIGSQFSGSGEVGLTEDGRLQNAKFQMSSDPVPVYGAQAARITPAFLQGRGMEYGFKIEATREIFAGLNGLAEKAVGLISLGRATGDTASVNQGQSLLNQVTAALAAQSGSGESGGIAGLIALLEARIRANQNTPTTQPGV